MDHSSNLDVPQASLVHSQLLAHPHSPFCQTSAVDSGVEIFQIEQLIEAADERGVRGGKSLFQLFNTHGGLDHTTSMMLSGKLEQHIGSRLLQSQGGAP